MKASNSRPKLFQVGGYTPTQLSQSQFIPTYTGIPLAEAEKYGTNLLDTYNKNVADLTQLDMLNANRKSTEGDAEVNNQIGQELQTQFEELAKKGDYESMTGQVNELARRYYNDPRRKAIEEQRQIADKQDELIQKIRADGGDPILMTDFNQHKSIVKDENGKWVPNIKQATVERGLDYTEPKRKIWGVLQANQEYTTSDIDAALPAIRGYKTIEELRGISGPRIVDNLLYAFDSYAGTTEYKQEKRVLQNQGLTSDQADKQIADNMLSEGMLRVNESRNPQFIQDWMLREAMANNADKSTRSLGVSTGYRLEAPEDLKTITAPFSNKISGRDPDIGGALGPLSTNSKFNPNTKYTPQELFKMREDRAKDIPPQERRTPEARAKFEKVSMAALAKYDPELLKSVINNNRAPANALKEILYSPETEQYVEQYQKDREDAVNNNIVYKYDESKGDQAKQKAAQDWIQNNYTTISWFDPKTGKVLNPANNPDFKLDPKGMVVTSETAGPNVYGTLAKDPRFFNAFEVAYTDPKTKEAATYFVAKDPLSKTYDPALPIISAVRAEGILHPFQVVTHKVGNTKLEFQDQTTAVQTDQVENAPANLLLYKIGDKNLTSDGEPMAFDSYAEMLIFTQLYMNEHSKK